MYIFYLYWLNTDSLQYNVQVPVSKVLRVPLIGWWETNCLLILGTPYGLGSNPRMDGPRLVLGASQASVRTPTGDIGSKKNIFSFPPALYRRSNLPSNVLVHNVGWDLVDLCTFEHLYLLLNSARLTADWWDLLVRVVSL